jgi:tripartite-type tricarboxylate transporter receptor subunit TctC
MTHSQAIKGCCIKAGRAKRLDTMVACVVSLFAATWTMAALAQAFPSKPIRLIVPNAPGGASDIAGRVYAQQLSPGLGVQVFVENRPGGGTTIGTEFAARSPADGHTLLLGTLSNMACGPSLYPNPGYDPIKSFEPISQLTSSLFVIVVHPSVPARSLKELISLARSRPGDLAYGSNGSGSLLHIAGEMFKAAADVDLVHVPYKGAGAAVVDLLTGRIQVVFDQLPTYHPHVQAGKLEVIAVAGPKRLAQLPSVPTVVEAGLPEYQVISWFGLLAPKGTPKEVIQRLNAEVLKASSMKEVRETLAARGAEAMAGSPDELAALIAVGVAKCSRAIRTSGIRID